MDCHESTYRDSNHFKAAHLTTATSPFLRHSKDLSTRVSFEFWYKGDDWTNTCLFFLGDEDPVDRISI